jgi:protein phosphatase 1 regulatory subunit 10
VKVPAAAVKDVKSDSSFFSAPKPKPKLPSFKKAPPAPAVKKDPDQNIAQPSSIDPFQEALKSMKSRKESPVAASTPPPSAKLPAPQPTGLTKLGKKKKSVTWAPEGQLEMIRLIEKAVYDDDPLDVSILIFWPLSLALMLLISISLGDTHPQPARSGS